MCPGDKPQLLWLSEEMVPTLGRAVVGDLLEGRAPGWGLSTSWVLSLPRGCVLCERLCSPPAPATLGFSLQFCLHLSSLPCVKTSPKCRCFSHDPNAFLEVTCGQMTCTAELPLWAGGGESVGEQVSRASSSEANSCLGCPRCFCHPPNFLGFMNLFCSLCFSLNSF